MKMKVGVTVYPGHGEKDRNRDHGKFPPTMSHAFQMQVRTSAGMQSRGPIYPNTEWWGECKLKIFSLLPSSITFSTLSLDFAIRSRNT